MTHMTLDEALSEVADAFFCAYGRVDFPAVSVLRAHLAKAAQPVEAVDIGVGRDIVKRLRDTPNWLKEAWGDFKSAGANKYDRAPKEAADYIETLLSALAHPRPTGDAIAEVAIVGWAWLLVDERTGHDYDRGFSWGEAKPDIPARAGTHYDYRALIGRDKAIAASGDCNAFIHSNRGLLHDLGAHVVVDVVDVEQQASPLVQEVPVRGARLSRDEGLTAPTDEQAGEVAWTKKAAEFIEKKAQSYADEFGRDDMGSISFGAGRGADKMEEYWMSLIDLAEDFRKLGGKCQVPPDGWECSRAVGHDGPCAASPTAWADLLHGTKLYAHSRPTVPDGYRLVPVEPTDDMCRNAREKIGIGSNVAHHVWHWMIAAAPDGEAG